MKKNKEINQNSTLSQRQVEIVEIWTEVLEIEISKIGIHQNFFDIGGTSIRLANMVNKINLHFDVNISIAEMFRLPTIFSIDEFLEKGDQLVEKTIGNIEESLDEANDNLNLLNDIIGE